MLGAASREDLVRKLCLLAAAMTAVAGAPTVAVAADNHHLRVADYLPSGHFLSRYFTQVWMKRVGELTGGRVTFDYFPAEQLGKAKDLLSLTQSGVTDVGLAAPSYITDKLPLTAVAELPGAFATSCEGTLALWELLKEGRIIDKEELEPLRVRIVFGTLLPPYQMYIAKGPLNGIEAARSKKLRAAGGARVLIAKRMGAVPVQMAAPELMESLSRGTIDGLFLSHASIEDYDLHHHLEYGTAKENFGAAVILYVVNRKTWNSLPPDIKQAFDTAGDEVVRSGCAKTDKDSEDSMALIEKAGVKLVELPAAERAKLTKLLSDVNREWATDLDRRGKAGSAVLGALEDAIKAKTVADQP